MGIDGIGRGGGPDGPGRIGGAGPEAAPAAAEEDFSLDATEAAAEPAAPGALEQLQRGEITVDQYLDARVDRAVEHLEGRLGSEELAFIRQSLREQLSVDPVLVELVRRATGGAVPNMG